MGNYYGVGCYKIFLKFPIFSPKKIRWKYPEDDFWKEIEGDAITVLLIDGGWTHRIQYKAYWNNCLYVDYEEWLSPTYNLINRVFRRLGNTFYPYPGGGIDLDPSAVYTVGNVTNLGSNPSTSCGSDDYTYDEYRNGILYQASSWTNIGIPATFSWYPLKYQFKIFRNADIVHEEIRETEPTVYIIPASCVYPLEWQLIGEYWIHKLTDFISVDYLTDPFNRPCGRVSVHEFTALGPIPNWTETTTILTESCTDQDCNLNPLYKVVDCSEEECPDDTCPIDCGDYICCVDSNGMSVKTIYKS